MPSKEPGFLERWSRRKLSPRPEPVETPAGDPAPMAESPREAGEPSPTLADLEGLGPDADIRAFLRERVPAELKRLALRRAWATDPAIAGHRSLADYDWDFNAPGYGALAPDDDVARLAAAIFREPVTSDGADGTPRGTHQPDAEPGAPEGATPAAEKAYPTVASTQPPAPIAFPEPSSQADRGMGRDGGRADSPPEQRRRHGGAIPK